MRLSGPMILSALGQIRLYVAKSEGQVLLTIEGVKFTLAGV